jgi:hypothetical protein
MTITFPGESAEYRAARDRLLDQEIGLRRQMEVVAAAHRKLPPGGEIPEDYVFQERGTDDEATDVRMSELFARGKDSLAIYTFMFPRYPDDERSGPTSKELRDLPLSKAPCPSCTAFLDQIDAALRHAGALVHFVAAAEAPVEQLTGPSGISWTSPRKDVRQTAGRAELRKRRVNLLGGGRRSMSCQRRSAGFRRGLPTCRSCKMSSWSSHRRRDARLVFCVLRPAPPDTFPEEKFALTRGERGHSRGTYASEAGQERCRRMRHRF